MTLPSATAIQFTARQPESAAEIFAQAAERRRKWAKIAKRAAPKQEEAVKVYVVRQPPLPPQQDEHVKAWRKYLKRAKETPIAFVRRRCEELGYPFSEITSPSRAHYLVLPRTKLMAETKVRYPRMSFPHIGKMFKRDHTTVMAAMRREGVSVEPVTMKSLTSKIKELFAQGATGAEIAKEIGFTKTSVNTFIRKQGWKR